MLTRRSTLMAGVATVGFAALGAVPGAAAAEKAITIGWDGSLTGGDAEGAILQQYGAMMAAADANAKQMVKGYRFEIDALDDGTATAGEYDPAQAAINARKFVSDKAVVGIVGPQMSGAAKAMLPILNTAGLSMITPSATNPDMTNPKFAAQFVPSGKTAFFRTVATDAYQGPYMANYFADVLHVKTAYILDDSGAYGVGLADAFEAQAKAKGIKILGRDRLDPKAADYNTVLTKIKSLNPDGLYYGGVMEAGAKLVKESYGILPASMVKGGGDGLQDPEMFTVAGFPAATGWYATVASPHVNEEDRLAPWVALYKQRYGKAPDDYAVTAYDATMAIVHAVGALVAARQPINRDTVREELTKVSFTGLQGPVAFDPNGDIHNKVVSVFQAKHNPAYPLDDLAHQYVYIGVAPAA